MMMNRRSFLRGAFGLVAAPAVVPFASLMPVRGVVMDVRPQRFVDERDVLPLFEPMRVGDRVLSDGEIWVVTTICGGEYRGIIGANGSSLMTLSSRGIGIARPHEWWVANAAAAPPDAP